MAPQTRAMEKKRWIKVGKVALIKAHPSKSVCVRLVSQTPPTTVNPVRRSNVILPTPLDRLNSYSHVVHASIKLENDEGKFKNEIQGIPKELKELMESFDKKALAVNYLLQEQRAILSKINKFWENYLENSELHA